MALCAGEKPKMAITQFQPINSKQNGTEHR